MKNIMITSAAAVAAMGLASPAMAQDAPEAEVYVGAQAGYHDIIDNPLGDDGGVIYGLYAGVDVPVGETIVAGVEGNFNLGTGAIDSEYGIVGKLGARVGDGGQIFLRGGYQHIDFDVGGLSNGLVSADDLDIADDDGDYLVGVGGQFKVSDNVSLRAVVDTVAFDTTRATVGLAVHF